MPIFLRFVLLLLCLGVLLPAGVRAEDDPPKPPAGAEEPKDPPKDPDEPMEPEDPPAIIEKEDVPTEPEEEPEPEVVVAPARKAEVKTYEHPDTPGGMTWVPPGEAVIGTSFQRLRQDLALHTRSKDVQRDFGFEAPQHRLAIDGLFVDLTEVTNAQYLVFMQETALASYNTDEATLANIEEVAGFLIGLPRDRWDDDDHAWRQLFRMNRDVLIEKMPDRVVKSPDDSVDERATEKAFHNAPLVRGMILNFYNRKPPQTWTRGVPDNAFLDFPVLSVSYNDCETYGEWAGKHVLSEQEWEYTARGPEAYFWPWGDEWFADASHANWGGKITGKDLPDELREQLDSSWTYRPVALPVGSLPEGRSWCGVYDMLGNAGEWTSSWFTAYPGNGRDHRNMGHYCKVIRGATYVDQDPLVLRLAARNFIGAGTKAPPLPQNRFDYIGFRCGWYPQPGRDQLGPIVRRVSRGQRVTSENVILGDYAGAAAVLFAAPGEEVENHVFVKGRAHSFVLIPLKTVFRPTQKTPKIRSRKALMKASIETDDPFPVAVLHTDVPLSKVYVRAPRDPKAAKSKRRRKKGDPPPTVPGTCKPGTYLLCVWHERLCLCYPSLDFVCFLQKSRAVTAAIDLQKIKPENRKPASIEVVADADVVFLSVMTPLGGASHDEKDMLVVKTIELNPQASALSDAGDWKIHAKPQ